MKQQIKQRIKQLNNGETPGGYKKTEFGIFPCDWETNKAFGDLFDFYGGLSKSRDELGEEGYAYLHYGDLHRGSFNCVSLEQYSQLPKCDIKLNGKETCLMEDGDVAFLDASEDLEGTSRAVLIDNTENEPFIAGLHIIYGKSKDDSLEKWYKQYITSSENVKKQFQRLSVGFKVYGVNRESLPKIRIAYPPSLQEQSRIAEILMKWDEAIELYQQQIEKLNKLKRSALANLFPQKGKSTPKYRFAGFTDPWEQRKFSDLALRESTFCASSFGLPGVEYEDVVAGEGRLNKDIRLKEVRKTGIVFDGTQVLYGKLRPYLHNWLSPDFQGVAIGDWWVLRPNGIDKNFLFRLIQTKQFDEVANQSSGSKMPRADWNLVSNTEFIVPSSLDEQKQIAATFDDLDTLITLHQRKVDTVAKQRAGLQQYLLNGIVRV